jgi:hypothetical protein
MEYEGKGNENLIEENNSKSVDLIEGVKLNFEDWMGISFTRCRGTTL